LCAKHEIRKKLGLNADDTILLFVGRISEQKGLHWLLPAFRETLSYNPDLQLLIIGQVMYHARAYAQARMEEVQAWGLSNNVHFLGRVSNVDDYLKAADLFVLPTSHEGFSNAIVEAMASGLPIVTSDIPEISRSQIENNKEGLLVSAGDTKQLAQAIIQLLKHPELCARLGKAARKRVIREFTYDIIGSHYSRLYQNLNTSIDP
jgi:glycosyltransferase involved in cell wall biosynthesis